MDRCEWEDHAGHTGCATVEFAGDVDSAGVADVGGEKSTYVAEPAAVGVAAGELDVDGSGVVGDAVVRTVVWVKQLLHCEMISVEDVQRMWELSDERQFEEVLVVMAEGGGLAGVGKP
jgi:hypothetical protein